MTIVKPINSNTMRHVNLKLFALGLVLAIAGTVKAADSDLAKFFKAKPTEGKLSIDKVYSVYLRNSGAIMNKNQIKGYFLLYQSDKIDRHTNEYTLQILDENLNKVKDIKFEDSKSISLLESAYNGSSISFLFKNEDQKTLDMKIYDFDGKLKYTYSRDFDRRTDDLMKQYVTMRTDEGTNRNVFDIGDEGYASVLPLRDGKQRTYELDYCSSVSKKQFTYTPEDAEKFAVAEVLGSTDSLVLLDVLKFTHAGKDATSHLVGINIYTHKKQFDVATDEDKAPFTPMAVTPLDGTNDLLVMGSYFESGANVMKDASKGLAIYEITSNGKIVNKTLNSWDGDFSKYLTISDKGRIDNVGYMYIHKIIHSADGKFFVAGEGYKRTASAMGIATTVLSGGRAYNGVTKMTITDMVVMQFDNRFKLTGATIYDKPNSSALDMTGMADMNSQHMIAMFLKSMGCFDYDFTTGDEDYSNFSICYSDWERTGDFKGKTFTSIHYNGKKFNVDKLPLKSKASMLKVFPGKPGSVMIMEYFKKDKRLDFRLEKLG